MNYWLLIIPVTSALIGWLTSYIMIKLLFYPRQPKKIMGITLQGILPKSQQQFARQLGKVVSTEFLSLDNIENKISDPGNLKNVMPMIETHVDDFLRNRIKEEMPMVSMFIGDKTIDTMKKLFLREIETLFPQVMKAYASNLKNDLKLEETITQKIMDLSPDKIKQLLQPVLLKESASIRILGAAIGFIIGLLQVAIICLLP